MGSDHSKLTLNIDAAVINDAKILAKFKGQSLSSLIESMLFALIQSSMPHKKKKDLPDLRGSVKKLYGSIKLPMQSEDGDDRYDYLMKKHS